VSDTIAFTCCKSARLSRTMSSRIIAVRTR
jgi:hypothetical protein